VCTQAPSGTRTLQNGCLLFDWWIDSILRLDWTKGWERRVIKGQRSQ